MKKRLERLKICDEHGYIIRGKEGEFEKFMEGILQSASNQNQNSNGSKKSSHFQNAADSVVPVTVEAGAEESSYSDSSSENESELAASEVGRSGFEAENSNSLETNISVRVKEAHKAKKFHKAKKSSPSSREH